MRTLRLTVPIDERENEALVQIARQEYRTPGAQLRHLLREEARRRGLLPSETGVTEEQGVNTGHYAVVQGG